MNLSRLPMRHILLGVALSAALLGCSDKDTGGAKGSPAPASASDIAAGKAIAERECKGCHGLDGKGVAPAIPNLAGQRDRYLLASLAEYKERKRMHAALREIATHLTDTDTRNVAAYYGSLPPIPPSGNAKEVFSAYDNGKAVSVSCAKCHNEDGNSTTPGTPSLAGQQPHYLATATQEYLNGARGTAPMHALIRGLTRLDLDSVVLYFASQKPAQRPAPPFGDAATGERLTLLCAGCHGLSGVSTDSATPSVASQDPQYLVEAIKSYRNHRRHEPMQHAVAALSDKDIENIAAFYTVQPSKPAEDGRQIVQDLTQRCNRCHDAAPDNAAVVTPILKGQDKEYLVMALRSYRDDRRESSTMHKMSLPYGDAIIESIATWYASQPAK